MADRKRTRKVYESPSGQRSVLITVPDSFGDTVTVEYRPGMVIIRKRRGAA